MGAFDSDLELGEEVSDSFLDLEERVDDFSSDLVMVGFLDGFR